MNWKECAALKERSLEVRPKFLSESPRFQWPTEGISGFNCESGVTISDIWGVISWVWTYPGDIMLSIEPAKKFFEIEGTVAIGAVGSTILSWLLMIPLLGFYVVIKEEGAGSLIGCLPFIIIVLWLLYIS
jgi:hypothetical protein